jgi:hypothetical protein
MNPNCPGCRNHTGRVCDSFVPGGLGPHECAACSHLEAEHPRPEEP